jgi:uncharacterized protein YbjT (DUF2867 family)
MPYPNHSQIGDEMKTNRKILLTGASGYVGGELLKRLETAGHEVNCLVRRPENFPACGPRTHVIQGDVLDLISMKEAFQGVDTAYFMVHFLAEKNNFEAKELEAAHNFASAARSAGVKRIIYLGGLGNESGALSPHLRSRQLVGNVLRESGVPTIEFRASIVLGGGSLSFRMIRDLTEKIPLMVMPKWASVEAQPIGIHDLLEYLTQALDIRLEHDEIVEIGGRDRMSYGDLLREYARQCGLRRVMIPVPVLSPWLSGHWLSIFTGVDAGIGRKLIEGMKNPTVVESQRARYLFNVEPQSTSQSMRDAIGVKSKELPQQYIPITSAESVVTKRVHAA